MKLRLMICAAAASTALFAGDNDATSDIYGVLAVEDSTTTNTVVGVPWRNVSATLSDVTLSNLVSTAGLTAGDKVYLYEETSDGSSVTTNWYEYVLSSAGVFEPSITVVFGKNVTPDVADVKTLPRGTGLIIQRANTTNPIYLCGRYDSSKPTATSVPARSQALIANPKTETVYITAGATGDTISVPGNGGTRNTYVKKDDGWYGTVTDTTTFPFPVTSQQKFNDGVPLAAGKGAFYTNNGNAAVEISW